MGDLYTSTRPTGPRRITRQPATAVVTRTAGGLYVTELDDDTRHPIGPCRGPADLTVGDVVLLIHTTERPWVAQVDEQEEV